MAANGGGEHKLCLTCIDRRKWDMVWWRSSSEKRRKLTKGMA